MRLDFTIVARPYSVNDMSYRDKRFLKQEFKEWQSAVLNKLLEHKAALDSAGKYMREHPKQQIKIIFAFKYPEHVFYNKQGLLSAKTIDLSNCEKPLLDVLFSSMLEVNDRRVTMLQSSKLVSSDYAIDISVESVD